MNHLAHFFLADHSSKAFTGALLGDFVKGKIDGNIFPQEMMTEILVHRYIDGFTDADVQVLNAKNVFKQTRRRFTGIAIDVAFDHFLARNWRHFTDAKLRVFADEVYVSLQQNRNYFPVNFQPILPRMVADDWLFAYQDFERVRLVLQRMSRRVRGGESLARAFDEIKANYLFFDELFKEFFPRLQDFVKNQRVKLSKDLLLAK